MGEELHFPLRHFAYYISFPLNVYVKIVLSLSSITEQEKLQLACAIVTLCCCCMCLCVFVSDYVHRTVSLSFLLCVVQYVLGYLGASELQQLQFHRFWTTEAHSCCSL